jgi:integrase
MSTKKHDSLHRVDWTPNWVFRRFSSEKGKEFVKSTGIPATDANAARAYKHGVELYDEWLGSMIPGNRTVLIRDIARAVLSAKAGRRKNTTRSATNQIRNHVIPAFGHMRPEQVTPLKWEQYDAQERKRTYRRKVGDRVIEYQRTKLFNTRKALIEILRRAYDEQLIPRVPKLRNFDPPADPPREIPWPTFRELRKGLPDKVRFLAFVMWWQGPRPSEALQYRLSMIRDLERQSREDYRKERGPVIEIPGETTKTGRSRSIPLNTRVARAVRWLVRNNKLEGDCLFPSREDPNQPLKNYNAAWDRAVAKLELDYTIYNLRDSYITRRLEEGESATYIAKYTDTSTVMIDGKYAAAKRSALAKVAG